MEWKGRGGKGRGREGRGGKGEKGRKYTHIVHSRSRKKLRFRMDKL